MAEAFFDYNDLKRAANEVASQLYAALRARRIDRINIDTIRGALVAFYPDGLTEGQLTQLEELVTRRVVEKVG